jgi:hypothetical protein
MMVEMTFIQMRFDYIRMDTYTQNNTEAQKNLHFIHEVKLCDIKVSMSCIMGGRIISGSVFYVEIVLRYM